MEIFSHPISENIDADGLALCCFCRNVVNYSNRRIAARPVLELMLVNRKSINENAK